MNTQVIIDVNGDPRQILECAYHTLLSMSTETTAAWYNDVPDISNYIDPQLLFARAVVIRSYTAKCIMACLVVVRQIDGIKCELSFSVDETISASPGKGNVILFMSEFLQMFSQNYSPAQPQS